MTTLAVKPEISLNTIVALAAVVGVIYIGYRIKNGVGSIGGSVVDFVKNVDINPFDSNGFLGLTVSPAVTSLANAAKQALAAKGKNIDNYVLYYPRPGEKLPADSWSVVYQGKTYYYIPKSSVGTFGKWISL